MPAIAKALKQDPDDDKYRTILGLRFFIGDAAEAVDLMNRGGLLVVPAAPALTDLPHNRAYREALSNADLIITDSAFMVLSWNLLERDNISRLSGLGYLRQLLASQELGNGRSFWIMPNEASAERNTEWLQANGISIPHESIYLAPMYGEHIDDPDLLARLRFSSPEHIIVAIGGGTQERLGLYLKHNLKTRPSIHCIGAAIAFLSGDQVPIPVWADKCYLGWLLRCLSDPQRFIRRYWQARKLLPMLIRFRERPPVILPPLTGQERPKLLNQKGRT